VKEEGQIASYGSDQYDTRK